MRNGRAWRRPACRRIRWTPRSPSPPISEPADRRRSCPTRSNVSSDADREPLVILCGITPIGSPTRTRRTSAREQIWRGTPWRPARNGSMICRVWRGWTTLDNADTYEAIVRGQVIPGIEDMAIAGFRHIDLLRRELGREVEFVTLMWFDDIESIKRFVGADYTRSHVPPAARAVLARFDERVAHYVVVDRREQA